MVGRHGEWSSLVLGGRSVQHGLFTSWWIRKLSVRLEVKVVYPSEPPSRDPLLLGRVPF